MQSELCIKKTESHCACDTGRIDQKTVIFLARSVLLVGAVVLELQLATLQRTATFSMAEIGTTTLRSKKHLAHCPSEPVKEDNHQNIRRSSPIGKPAISRARCDK
ncbi:hypothetical protein QR680_007105 [Steinernema hermaphroditum]|uniref:Uncharacterized protein n=1 Tax=Steinernema hermaphroditum TaxID=289476 RepID=A0AA39HXL0_9BILA|nr:hypothetical protein QR680_007105 [Steinernema hermaphroditum]